MNPQAPPVARPLLNVALFDFAAEFSQHPERALDRLHFLVLDEDTCLARVAFLQALADLAGPVPGVGPTAEDFRDEIALLCEDGLFAAHADGRLTADRIQR